MVNLVLQAGIELVLILPFAGAGFVNAVGNPWRIQRQAGQIFTSPETLSLVASTTIPRNLPVLFRPLDNMAHNGEIIDFAKLARDFTLALFGELSFDVSPA